MYQQSHNYSTPQIFADELGRFKPGAYATFVESIKEGIINSPLSSIVTLAQQFYLEGTPLIKDWTSWEWAQAHSPPISEEDFNLFREDYDIQYEKGMTIGSAELVKKIHMRDQAYQWFTRNVGPWDPTRIGGFLVGGTTDPTAWIPFGGVLMRMSATSRLLKTGLPLTFKNRMKENLMDVALTAGISGVATAAVEPIIGWKRMNMQQPWGVEYALADVGFAIGAGSLLSGFGKVATGLVKAPFAWRAGALAKSSADLADGEFASPGTHSDPNNHLRSAGRRNPEYDETPEGYADAQNQNFNERSSKLRDEADAILGNETIRTFAGEVKGVVPEIVQGVREKFGLAWESWGKGDFHKFISNVRDCVLRGRI